jgi:Rod binding domain-containing protein
MVEALTPAAATVTSAKAEATAHDSPEKIREAAQQFESLLVAYLLRTMRPEGGGWLGTGDDPTASSAMELAEEQFAQALAAQGGLGLAKLVADGLKPEP